MKESVTKFDLEAAFKALDEIDVPASEKGIKANRPALNEIFSRKSKFESLFEEYYDVGSTEELGEAKEAREAEIAKAKLARIEKIVDLDAESPDDLLTSYVGKYIVQCPQCMTLFYKDKEDVVESEEDPTTVNVGEQCQHCGNESGYALIGKVGEAEPEETEELAAETEITEETPIEEEPAEENAEESTDDDATDELGELDLDLEDLESEESTEEEKTEESFVAHTGEALVEEISDDKELDAKLKAHGEYIEYLRNTIAEEEATLEKTDNEQVKAAIQRRIDAFKADLEAALPEEVKNSAPVESTEEATEESVEETEPAEAADQAVSESLKETFYACAEIDGEERRFPFEDREEARKYIDEIKSGVASEFAGKKIGSVWTECLNAAGETLTEALKEEADLEVSADEFEKLINDPEFKKPISDTAVRAMLNSEKEPEESSSVKESKSIYICDDCGYEVELDDAEYDGMCPHCHEHHGFYKLEEGIFDKLKLTRAGKADWVLANALKDYNKAVLQNNGNAETSDDNKKFTTFVIACFTNKFTDGKEITSAPALADIGKLVKGKDPELKSKYVDAENIAKGWSKIADNGPAIIFMAKDVNDPAAEFVCQYFNGDLDKKSDQLVKLVEVVKNGLAGIKSMKKGHMGEADVKKLKASEIKKGMRVKINDKDSAEVVEVAESRLGLKITFKFKDGTTDSSSYPVTQELVVFNTPAAATEGLDTAMTGIEELQESVLETLISDSLVEAYGNVAGYKLDSCEYLNEQFKVNGIIYFTSGNTRKTTFAFTEAYVKENKVNLIGLNEKLGSNKQFTLAGKIDNKTLIAESFSYVKK